MSKLGTIKCEWPVRGRSIGPVASLRETATEDSSSKLATREECRERFCSAGVTGTLCLGRVFSRCGWDDVGLKQVRSDVGLSRFVTTLSTYSTRRVPRLPGPGLDAADIADCKANGGVDRGISSVFFRGNKSAQETFICSGLVLPLEYSLKYWSEFKSCCVQIPPSPCLCISRSTPVHPKTEGRCTGCWCWPLLTFEAC